MDTFIAAGIGFGREETFRLSLSLIKLAQKTNASGLRIWGKMLGRQGDYYIAEATNEDAGEFDPALQEGTEGANKYRYWALETRAMVDNGMRRTVSYSIFPPSTAHPPDD